MNYLLYILPKEYPAPVNGFSFFARDDADSSSCASVAPCLRAASNTLVTFLSLSLPFGGPIICWPLRSEPPA